MREKAKDANKRGVSLGRGNSSGFGFSSGISSGGLGGISSLSLWSQPSVGIGDAVSSPVKKPAPARNTLKLGGKSKDVDSFVDHLKKREKVSNLAPTPISAAIPVAHAKTSVATEE